jgi:hypothetical protein
MCFYSFLFPVIVMLNRTSQIQIIIIIIIIILKNRRMVKVLEEVAGNMFDL